MLPQMHGGIFRYWVKSQTVVDRRNDFNSHTTDERDSAVRQHNNKFSLFCSV